MKKVAKFQQAKKERRVNAFQYVIAEPSALLFSASRMASHLLRRPSRITLDRASAIRSAATKLIIISEISITSSKNAPKTHQKAPAMPRHNQRITNA
ncbi:hypothetical protein [Duncaniella muris]|uniref:hypothetical protein n=2 Tax=Duncaniella muris TaxID=2094150 RepID=UPI002714CC8A|nr:hypothetical protein [Duncaniella muris]